MNRKNIVGISGLTYLVSALTIAPPAFSEGFVLEEIITTARKREENVQTTPVAVSAFTEKELQLRQIDSTDKLGDITPNLVFESASPSSGSSSAAQIFIRGVGQTDFTPVTDPGVGLYIDGIYMARSVGNVLDFLDVDRIEVLRGPQGTLFGRNTIGGAVVINSQRPTDELGGNLQLQIGDDSMAYVTAKANIPIAEGVAANIAGSVRTRDGYVTRLSDGVQTGDEDSTSVRGSLSWDLTENFAAYVTADYTKIDENGAPGVSGGVNDLAAFGTFGNALLASCTGVTINPNFPVAGPPSFPPPGVGAGGAPGCYGPDSFAGEFTSEGTFPVKSELDIWGVSGELVWHINDRFSIKSITGYREMDMESARDGDKTPANIFATQDFYEHEQISQELQFSGSGFDDALQWLVGLYYFQEEGANINPVFLPVGTIQSGGLYDNDSNAIFAQGTYSATDKLSLTFGVRRTEDTKRFTPDQISLGDSSGVGLTDGSANSITNASGAGFFGNTWPNFADIYLGATGPLAVGERLATFAEAKRDFDDTNIMANIAYQWTDTVMTYITYSEGFKSGGFDQRYTGFTPVPSSYEPETVDSIEIGLKSEFLDSRVRLNAALFTTDYEDLHIIIRESFNPITFNGGTADISGAEFELSFVPTDDLYITASLGYIDAEYDTLSPAVSSAGTNATPVLITNSLVNTPELSFMLGAAYTMELGSLGTLTPRVDWSFHDEQYNDAVNTPQLFQDSYNLLNAALSFESTDGRWEAILALRNVTDEKYLITGNSAFGTAAAYVEQVYGRPAEWSLAVKYTF